LRTYSAFYSFLCLESACEPLGRSAVEEPKLNFHFIRAETFMESACEPLGRSESKVGSPFHGPRQSSNPSFPVVAWWACVHRLAAGSV